VCGRSIRAKQNGKSVTAEIHGEMSGRWNESTALCIPAGMLASDQDPDEFRVIVVESKPGLNAYHQVRARAVSKNFFGLSTTQPQFGTYRALPRTKAQQIGAKRDGAKEAYEVELAQRRAQGAGSVESSDDISDVLKREKLA
jgi:hypothetical protein